MPVFEAFLEDHITGALALWGETEHIGLSSADDPQSLAYFLARNPGCSFIVREDSRMIGACLCGHDGRRGYIHHLAVALAYRRTRLASQLLSRCLAALRDAGIQKCHAFVFHTNPNGDLFWTPQGWERRDDLRVYSKHTFV